MPCPVSLELLIRGWAAHLGSQGLRKPLDGARHRLRGHLVYEVHADIQTGLKVACGTTK